MSNLSNELIKYIINIIEQNSQKFPYNESIKIIADDDEILNAVVFCAEINLDTQCKFAITNISDLPDYPIYSIIQSNTNIFGLMLEHDLENFDNVSNISKFDSEKNLWVPVSLLFQLNLAAALEMIVQNGLTWNPITDKNENLNLISKLKDLINYYSS